MENFGKNGKFWKKMCKFRITIKIWEHVENLGKIVKNRENS